MVWELPSDAEGHGGLQTLLAPWWAVVGLRTSPLFQVPLQPPSFHAVVPPCAPSFEQKLFFTCTRGCEGGIQWKLPVDQRDKLLQALAEIQNEKICELVAVGPERLFGYEHVAMKKDIGKCWYRVDRAAQQQLEDFPMIKHLWKNEFPALGDLQS